MSVRFPMASVIIPVSILTEGNAHADIYSHHN